MHEPMEKKPTQEPSSPSPSPSPIQSTASDHHPYDFHVCGPRNLSSPSWRDLIRSNWKDPKYVRMVIACFIQAVYLLELDRQENRPGPTTAGAAAPLAPKWWKPFKYKLAKTLTDPRDGSIYGAVLEWDRSAAMSDFVLVRPSGAPRAVLALRGTLLKSATIRRDLMDDLRFFAWESLKGSVRFDGILETLRSLVSDCGSHNVCIGGHSLGAGFALQVGKALAKEGIFVDCHLFNPPSVSLAMGFRSMGEKAGFLWNRVRSAVSTENADAGEEEEEKKGGKRLCRAMKKWAPNLYVNNSDYICCHYAGDAKGAVSEEAAKEGGGAEVAAKLFVMMSKGPQKFLEAHGLEQWWAEDMELELALNHSRLINRQLKSLYDTKKQ